MQNFVTRFVKDESGATAIEYGLIAVGIIAAGSALGNSISGTFDNIATELDGATA